MITFNHVVNNNNNVNQLIVLSWQIFPKSEGWPFPRYRGACGRFIVEEYIGKSLASYYNADWETRLDLAYQVRPGVDLYFFGH